MPVRCIKIFGKKSEIFRNLGPEFLRKFEFGAVQKCVHRVDLEKMLQNEYLVAKFGFDTAENESQQVMQFSLENWT